MNDSSLLFLNTEQKKTVKIEPCVFFSITDHYSRRLLGEERVTGTLLGTFSSDGLVEIKSSFPVPYPGESDGNFSKLAEHHAKMTELHHTIHPHEVILGWYSTGSEINSNTVSIHQFYQKQSQFPSPIHLLFEPNIAKENISIKAFIHKPISIGGTTLSSFFEQIPIDFSLLELDKIGLHILAKTKNKDLIPSVTNLEEILESIYDLLENIALVSNYIDAVISGKCELDVEIGRKLVSLLDSLPMVDPDIVEGLVKNSFQDLLMVVYLTNMVRTQLLVAEKLRVAIA